MSTALAQNFQKIRETSSYCLPNPVITPDDQTVTTPNITDLGWAFSNTKVFYLFYQDLNPYCFQYNEHGTQLLSFPAKGLPLISSIGVPYGQPRIA